MLTGDVHFEAAIALRGTLPVQVQAPLDEQEAARIARAAILPLWEEVCMAFAHYVREELVNKLGVTRLQVVRTLSGEVPELLVDHGEDEPPEESGG